MTVVLPTHASQTKVSIEASVASLTLHVPTGVGVIIHTNKALSSAEVDLSRFMLDRDANEYRTANYASAANRVDLRITLAAGSVKVV